MSRMRFCDICNKNEKQVELDKYEMRKRNRFKIIDNFLAEGMWEELDICVDCMNTIKTAMRDGIESVEVKSETLKNSNVTKNNTKKVHKK